MVNPLVENDDGGEGKNFRIVRQVQAGTYYIVVNGAENRQVLGTYSPTVRFTPAGGGTTVGGGDPRLGGNTPLRAGRFPIAGRYRMGTKEPNAAPEWSGTPLNSEMTGTLEGPGDMTSFPVDVPEAGMSTVETNGTPHTVGHFGAGERLRCTRVAPRMRP